ncbi:MAG: YadA-like family protein, partial [Megasphaera elsdenii]|nr:YadA-like family protein [Megasphaera elsdenii]
NNTVDKSEQLIKANDTQYSATTKTATKMEDALVSGSSGIDVIKNLDDAANPLISSAVTDGTNSTGVTQTAKDITNTAKNGTITNDAKDIVNNAGENMTNTVGKDLTTTVGGEMKTTVTGKTTENYNGGLETTITGEEKHTVNGSQTTTVTVDSSLSAKNITNTATEKLSNSATDIENKASTSILNQVGDNTSWKMTNGQVVESIKGADGQTNTTTTTADDTYQSVQNGNNVLAKRTSSTNDNLNITDGTNTYSKITTATSNKQTVTDGTETASTNLTKSASNTYITNGTQTVTNHIAADTTNTVMNEGSNGSRQEQTASQILDRVTDGTNTNSTTTTASGTTFENTAHNTALTEMTKHESGDFTKTTISGNTIETGQATMDYAEVMKDLGVHGNATVDGNTILGKEGANTTLTVNSKSTFKDTVKMEKTLEVDGTSTFNDKVTVTKGGLDVTGGTTTDTLHVTSTSTFDGKATFKDIVTMEKDLSVGGNATVAGSMTASSYKVGDKTYISESGINANNQKVVNVAAGDLSANSTDAVNGAQLYQTNERVTSVENRVGTVENRVDKLDSRVDKVGANAAALANLHPLEFDADSKWNIAAAVGGYKGETATAIGAFYRPNENVMVNVSSSFGTGENMYGGGISLRIGQGGNKARRNATNGLTEREKAMQKQIDSLTSRLDALLSVINPNMSKDFPDVPENHWAYEAVSRLAGNGVIQGYEDGKYHGDRTMTRYEMAEIIYNALSKGAKAEKKLVEEFKPELQAMAAQKKA